MPSTYHYFMGEWRHTIAVTLLVILFIYMMHPLIDLTRAFWRWLVRIGDSFYDHLVEEEQSAMSANVEPIEERARRLRRNAQQRAYRARKKAEAAAKLAAKLEAKKAPKESESPRKDRLDHLLEDDDL